MAQETFVEIRCEGCSTWFPTPSFITDQGPIDRAGLIGLTLDCSFCGHLTDCSEGNTRFRARHDELLGIEQVISYSRG